MRRAWSFPKNEYVASVLLVNGMIRAGFFDYII